MTIVSNSHSGARNIADTARWMAYFRAQESLRADAFFNDPFAECLAGQRGLALANTLPDGNKHQWAWATRTYLFDKFVLDEIEQGSDLVLNLAAGLDARPYRMQLPPNLQWVEVDLPEIVSYKEETLAAEKPQCRLERIVTDLSQRTERSALFSKLNGKASKITILTEGLLIYFSAEEVSSLARDLAAAPHFRSWIVDLASPGQLALMRRTTGKDLSQVGAAFKFGPPEGPDFFAPHGWQPRSVQGILKTATQFNRSPAELLSLLPEPKSVGRHYPWSGVCLLKRAGDCLSA